jgi:hypothetical protein
MPERSDYPQRWTVAERESWIAEYIADEHVEFPNPEHDNGECEGCDALRALMQEAEERCS